MQYAIEMGISLPNTENFSPFFENIKFGHQNMLLKRMISSQLKFWKTCCRYGCVLFIPTIWTMCACVHELSNSLIVTSTGLHYMYVKGNSPLEAGSPIG